METGIHRFERFARRAVLLCGLAMVVVAIASTTGLRGQARKVGMSQINTDANGLALRGYDAVAYVTEGRAAR
jgi:hypothetical protein